MGSIQYIAGVTRPDLSYAAHALAKQMCSNAKEHWKAVQHVLRYLQSTKNVGITFNGSNKDVSLLDVYTDADFANCADLRSVFGCLVRVYGNCCYAQCIICDVVCTVDVSADAYGVHSRNGS